MSKSALVFRTVAKAARLLPFVVAVLVGVPLFGMALNEATKLAGLKSVPVPVVGTGSMYPSLFWSKEEGGPENDSEKMIEEYRSTPHLYRRYQGITVAGRTYLRRHIAYGDMVAFRNDQTREILAEDSKDTAAGFIKRIIGVPGDTIELRDGFVYKNGALLEEPYIAAPRSTYGGTTIADCQRITLSDGTYLVLGDNRKVSSDSRFELGLIKEGDIEYLLPYSEQKIYHSLWRDTSKDEELLGVPTLSGSEFVELLNSERKRLGISALTFKSSLVKSSGFRGDKLLQNASTPYDMQQAVRAAGYSNIVLGEFVSHGHFSAKELLENLLFSGKTASQVLSIEYDDIGLTAIDRVVDGCPTQVIVGHLGGYIPASYDPSLVSSWQGLQGNLAQVIPSWQAATSYEQVDQTKLQELLTILRRRQTLADEILAVMQKQAWLTPEQEVRIKADEQDAKAAEELSKTLNEGH